MMVETREQWRAWSVFTEAELAYLAAQPLGRLATLGPDGAPQTRPVGFRYNPDLDTVDIGGHDMGASRKYRNVQADPACRSWSTTSPPPTPGRPVGWRSAAEPTPSPPAGRCGTGSRVN